MVNYSCVAVFFKGLHSSPRTSLHSISLHHGSLSFPPLGAGDGKMYKKSIQRKNTRRPNVTTTKCRMQHGSRSIIAVIILRIAKWLLHYSNTNKKSCISSFPGPKTIWYQGPCSKYLPDRSYSRTHTSAHLLTSITPPPTPSIKMLRVEITA